MIECISCSLSGLTCGASQRPWIPVDDRPITISTRARSSITRSIVPFSPSSQCNGGYVGLSRGNVTNDWYQELEQSSVPNPSSSPGDEITFFVRED